MYNQPVSLYFFSSYASCVRECVCVCGFRIYISHFPWVFCEESMYPNIHHRTDPRTGITPTDGGPHHFISAHLISEWVRRQNDERRILNLKVHANHRHHSTFSSPPINNTSWQKSVISLIINNLLRWKSSRRFFFYRHGYNQYNSILNYSIHNFDNWSKKEGKLEDSRLKVYVCVWWSRKGEVIGKGLG